MDITKILAELRRELEYLDAAINSLERLQEGTLRRQRQNASQEFRRTDQPGEAGQRRAREGGGPS